MITDFFLLEEEDYPIFAGLYKGDIESVSEDCLLFGAVADGEPAALSVLEYIPENEAFWLAWIYVDSEKRRYGIGSSLLGYMTRKTRKSVMVDNFQAPVWDEEMKSFFRACGFTISDFPGCHIYEGKLSELIELKDYKSNIQGKPVFDLTAEEQREIENDLEHDPNAFVFRFDPKTCLPESRYIRNQDGLQALLLLQEDQDALVVPYVYAKQGNGAALMSLLVEAERSIRQKMDPNTLIRLTTVNDKAEALVKKLLPKAEQKPVYLAEEDLLML